jgi:hypothetical protein
MTKILSSARLALMVGLLAVVALIAAACGGEDPTPTATSAPVDNGNGTTEPTPTPEPTEVDFAGKSVRITVGFAPGGGFDTFARVFAVHLQKSLPGNPKVVVSNLPGANTLIAAKSVVEKPVNEDQVDIVLIISTLIQSEVLTGVDDFDLKDFSFLGAPDYTPSDQVWCTRTEVADSLDAFFALGRPLTVAQIGAIDIYATTTKWAINEGFPFDPVFGYTGTSDMNAAFNRGEVEITGTCRQSEVLLNPEWATGFATPLFYTVVQPQWITDGQAQGKWGWVKPVTEVAKEKYSASDESIAAFEAYMEVAATSRVFAMPSKTDAAVTAAMQKAFNDVVGSEAFVADMVQRGLDVGLISGADLTALVNGLADAPAAQLDVIRAMFPEN